MKNILLAQFAIALTLTILSLNTYALNCNEESPTKVAEGDDYYVINEFAPLKKEEIRTIKKMFKRFNRALKGKITHIECAKTLEFKDYIQTKNENVSAEITVTGEGEVLIEMDVSDLLESTVRIQTQRYFTKDSIFEIRNISKSSFSISSKARRANAYEGSHVLELITDLVINDNSITIITTEYINGYFGLTHTIELKK